MCSSADMAPWQPPPCTSRVLGRLPFAVSALGCTWPSQGPLLTQRDLASAHTQNWGGSAAPAVMDQHLVPHTTAEVANAVKAAADAGKRVRAIGKGHTWTPMFFDNDRVRLMPNMPRGICIMQET